MLTEARSLHPMATFSLTRGALLAGSTAVWLLAPDDPARRQARGMAYAREWLENRRQWNRDVRDSGPSVKWRTLATVQRAIAMRLHGLDLHQPPTHARRMPKPTELVQKSARIVFPGQDELRAQLVLHWRSTSSDAHGLGWGALTRTPTPHRALPKGQHEFGVGGDKAQTASHFAGAFLVAQWAWRRFAEMGDRT